MAKEDIKSKAAAAAVIGLPEGYGEDGFSEVGLLTPMYKPKNAFAEKWPTVVGWLSHVEALPKQVQKNKDGEEEDWIPIALNIILTAPNKGILGKKGSEKIVERAVGESLLVPLTGSLLYKKELMIAAFDASRIWLARISVTGQQASDYPSDMWVWKSELHNKPRVRKDDPSLSMVETALPPAILNELPVKITKALPPAAFAKSVQVPMMGGGVTSSGEVYDKDGVIQPRLVSGQA